MAQILPLPNFQPLDSNGAIIPAGQVFTYAPGTTTPKTTWQDAGQTIPNANPVVLDSSGSALIYGDGAYRLQIYNANSVLIRDMISASWISTAMQPVTDGATVATAQGLFGVRTTGQCRLVLTSTTQITLNPYNGNFLTINGATQQVPSGGVTMSNAGLSASTLYYIYAFMNASTMTLEGSTTAYAVSTADGTTIKTGDTTRALVGMVFMDAATHFIDSAALRNVASWFNRIDKTMTGTFAITGTTSAAFIEASTALRVQATVWADDAISIGVIGTAHNATGGNQCALQIGRDGIATTLLSIPIAITTPTNNYDDDMSTTTSDQPTEGNHFWTIAIASPSGTGTSFSVYLSGLVRN